MTPTEHCRHSDAPEKGAACHLPSWPQEMIEAGPCWCGASVDKKPLNPRSGHNAKSSDPATWGTFSETKSAQANGRVALMGFMFAPGAGFFGLDLDHALDDEDNPKPWAARILEILPPTWQEKSLSGKGLHAYFKAPHLPTGRRYKIDGADGGVECYTSGRFFVTTGQTWDDSPSTLAELDELDIAQLNDVLSDLTGYEVDLYSPRDTSDAHDSGRDLNINIGAALPQGILDALLDVHEFAITWHLQRPELAKADGSPDASRYDAALANLGLDAGLSHDVIGALIRTFRIKNDLNPRKGLRAGYVENTIKFAMKGRPAPMDTISEATLNSAKNADADTASPVEQSGDDLEACDLGEDTSAAHEAASAVNKVVWLTTQLQKKPLAFLQNNEAGDASVLVALMQGSLTYDHGAGAWYGWMGHSWSQDLRDEATRTIDKVVAFYRTEQKRQTVSAAAHQKNGKQADAKEEERIAKALGARVAALQSYSRRQNILKLAAAGERSLGVTGEEWDADKALLGVDGGVLELRREERRVVFRPGAPDDMIRTTLPTMWPGAHGTYDLAAVDVLADAPTFVRFLTEVFADNTELIAYLQRLFGYALGGTVEEHVFPIFWGKGRNGKSTLLAALGNVLGPLAGPVKSELLLAQRSYGGSSGHNADLLTLRGKRLAWASETNLNRRFDEAVVKFLVGGDRLIARAPYGRREETWEPSHTLVLCTNNRPRASLDYAFWQRVALVPFTQKFVAKPSAPNERQADRGLTAKLKAEAPSILAWLVAGLMKFWERGLDAPETVVAATTAYAHDQDTVGQFIEDQCVLGTEMRANATDFYMAYAKWCDQEAAFPLGKHAVARYMADRFTKTRRATGIFWLGVGIKVEEEDLDGIGF